MSGPHQANQGHALEDPPNRAGPEAFIALSLTLGPPECICALYLFDSVLNVFRVPAVLRFYTPVVLIGLFLTPLLIPIGLLVAAFILLVSRRARHDWRVWFMVFFGIASWFIMTNATRKVF
jgi:hypothetical protein